MLDSAGDCLVHGHLDVLDEHDPNSKRDVEVFLFTADDFANWKSNARAAVHPIFHAGPQTATTLNVGLAQSGVYNLVVSNRWSVITHKTVVGQVTVTCHGVQPHHLLKS